jgi:hypothetical protein
MQCSCDVCVCALLLLYYLATLLLQLSGGLTRTDANHTYIPTPDGKDGDSVARYFDIKYKRLR